MFYLPKIIAVMLLSSLLGFSLGMLSGCGQKGPLFLAPQSVPYSPFSSSAAAPPATPPATPASAAK